MLGLCHSIHKDQAIFDSTIQSDTTRLTQSQHNCVDIHGHVGQQAPQAGLFCLPYAYKLRSSITIR